MPGPPYRVPFDRPAEPDLGRKIARLHGLSRFKKSENEPQKPGVWGLPPSGGSGAKLPKLRNEIRCGSAISTLKTVPASPKTGRLSRVLLPLAPPFSPAGRIAPSPNREGVFGRPPILPGTRTVPRPLLIAH